MRVLNVLHDERFGGPQSRVLQVATRLRGSGVETVVVIPRGERLFGSLLDESGIPWYELDLVRPRQTSDPRAHLQYARHFWSNVVAVRTLLKQERIDLVHANGLCNLQAPLAARLEGIPLVWHLNDVGTPRLLVRLFLPLLRRWASAVAMSAKAVSSYYFPEPMATDGRFFVLYPPVDCRRFHPEVDGTGVRAELGIDPSAPVVGVVGNLNPDKGFHHFLRAVPSIKRSFPDAKFMIVGSPLETRKAYAHSLVSLATELGVRQDVIFTGRRSDVPRVLAAMSVYVQAARVEAIGMANMEASAVGLPVVATAVGGAAEIVEEGTSGTLIEPECPAAIARAVEELLRAPEKARDMGRHGAARMQELFSVDACVDAHLRVYRASVGEQRPGQPRFRPLFSKGR